jgi:hypothetical protein
MLDALTPQPLQIQVSAPTANSAAENSQPGVSYEVDSCGQGRRAQGACGHPQRLPATCALHATQQHAGLGWVWGYTLGSSAKTMQ